MTLDRWNDYIRAICRACESHQAVFPMYRSHKARPACFEVQPPAHAEEVAEVEAALQQTLPSTLRKFFLEFSKSVDLAWQLPEEVTPPAPFSEIFSGQLDLDLYNLTELQQVYRDWVNTCFSNPESAYDRVWLGKFPILKAPNDDLVAIDPTTETVVYLSHDDGEGHGYQLGRDVIDFVDRFLQIGCPGLEDSQWLPFTADRSSGIEPQGEAAKQWRKWFSMNLAD